MRKKRIVILGAGISGLTAAWYFLQKNPDWECAILEESKEPGGYIQTEEKRGEILEKGPHIFKSSRNQDFLQLVQELGFFHELIGSDKKATSRYVWSRGKLHKMPGLFLLSFCISLCKEMFVPIKKEDETIFEFGCRRFGKAITETLLDSLTLGVYGGDYRKLSVSACFPMLKKWEKEKGSVLLGAVSSLFNKKKQGIFLEHSLFSFRQGLFSFIQKIIEKMDASIFYEEKVVALEKKGEFFSIKTERNVFFADKVIVALPAYVAGELLKPFSQKLSENLCDIRYQSIISVNVLFSKNVGLPCGFGYLIPQKEQETILGCLFDSNIFPSQGSNSRLTLLVEGSTLDEDILHLVDRAIKGHLKIQEDPSDISFKRMARAIPQPALNHFEKIEVIRKNLPQEIYLVGNYLEGVSVNDCIRLAKKTAHSILTS